MHCINPKAFGQNRAKYDEIAAGVLMPTVHENCRAYSSFGIFLIGSFMLEYTIEISDIELSLFFENARLVRALYFL